MFLFYKIYFYVIGQFGHILYWIFVKFQQVCKGMINNIGIQLFAILDQANGTVSAKDICGMVNNIYQSLDIIKTRLSTNVNT